MLDPSLLIYEDDDILVLDKPAGVIVNRASTTTQITLQEQLADYLHLPPIPPEMPCPGENAPAQDVFRFRQGLVHRLDKNTSGVILWAKTPAALQNLLKQFKNRLIQKTYLCLVHGHLHEPAGRIFLPLARKRTNRQIMAVDPDGRPALTLYDTLQVYNQIDANRLLPLLPASAGKKVHARDLRQLYQGFTLLRVQPQTGRTHQIRAHLTHLGHPLVGDTAYLPRRKAKIDPYWCPRQFLHAARLEFTHPVTGVRLHFEAELPADLRQALEFIL